MMRAIEKAARAFCDEWGYSWEHDPDDEQTLAPDGEEVTYCRPSRRDCTRAARAAVLAFLDGVEAPALAAMIARDFGIHEDHQTVDTIDAYVETYAVDFEPSAHRILSALRAQAENA